MRRSVWATLGVPASADRAAVRRAYAAKLKETHPEDDPEGFQALRVAYEAALRQVEWREQGWRDDEEDEGDDDANAETGEDADGEAAEPPRYDPAPAAADPDSVAPPPDPDDPFAQHARDMNQLGRLLEADGTLDPSDLRAALQQVLSSPVLANLGVRADAEAWLAGLLLRTAPRSDPAIAWIASAFDWESRRGRWDTDWAIASLLERQEDVRHLTAMGDPKDHRHKAFVALSSPVTEAMRRRGAPRKLARDVKALIERMERLRPSLLERFDEEAVTWWRFRSLRPASPLMRTVQVFGVIGSFIVVIWASLVVGAWLSEDVGSLRIAARNAPEDATAWAELCASVAEEQRLDRQPGALAECSRAIELDPLSLTSRDNRALLNLRLSSFSAAHADYDAVLKLSPNNARALFGRGLAKTRGVDGEPGAGLDDRSLALAIDPTAVARFDRWGLTAWADPAEPAAADPSMGPPPPAPMPAAARRPDYKGPDWLAESQPDLPYPEAALSAEKEGRVRLVCQVGATGALNDCIVWEETPQGFGFGEVSLKHAKVLRMRPATAGGEAVDGVPALIPFRFQLAGKTPPG